MKEKFLIFSIILFTTLITSIVSKDIYMRSSANKEKEQKIIEIEKDIKNYLNMTVREIIKANDISIFEDGTLEVYEANIYYPCIFLENSLFFILCRNRDESYTPIYISFYDDKLNSFLLNYYLNKKMNFNEIMQVMGKTKIENSTFYNKNKYKIEYVINELNFIFISYYENGNDFELYISLHEN